MQGKEKPLNILIIGEYFPPDLGGAATRVSNVAKALSESGNKVTIITAFPHYPTGKIPKEYKRKLLTVENNGNWRVFRSFILPLESEGLFKRLLVFSSFLFSSLFAFPFVGKIDVVWAANPDVFALVPASIYGLFKRKPIISNVDDLIIEDLYDLDLVSRGSPASRIAEVFARMMFARVKAATPISPGYIPTIVRYGVDRKCIEVVRGGVDIHVFKPIPRSVKREFVVLYSGGFSIAYDFEQIFRAAREIEELDSDVLFIIQGKGELLGSMCARVKELSLTNVYIVDKLLSREVVGEFLSSADVLILPLADFKTPYRGMSSKLYEYQAVGRPIICCSNGLPAEFVKETQSGFVVNPGDSKGLIQAILKLKNDPIAYRVFAENGRKWVENEASIEAVGSKMQKVFRLCLSKRQSH